MVFGLERKKREEGKRGGGIKYKLVNIYQGVDGDSRGWVASSVVPSSTRTFRFVKLIT